MISSQMTKTVDLWTSKQKQDLITDVKSLVDSECVGYSSDDVIQVVLVGSYVLRTPTVDSDVVILVEVPLRYYDIPDTHKTTMKDGKKITIAFRDKLKTPMIDQYFSHRWCISKYSLTNDEMIIGTYDDDADYLKYKVYWTNFKKIRGL